METLFQRSKFSWYRLGVGPRWPLYLDPSVLDPYGTSAEVVIWMKLIWPIFMPGYRVIGRLATFDSSSVAWPWNPGSMKPAVEWMRSPSLPREDLP